MNIMKTNMLSLDNKIAKEQAVNSNSAQVLSAVQPQMGMNALMFQGMQNVMANPKLAQGIGVMNDDAEPVNDESAKSYVAPFSSNVAFRATNKAAIKSIGTLAAVAAAALVMTSCEKDKPEVTNINNITEQNVSIEIDLSPVVALLANMQTMVAQFMAQTKESDADQLAQLQKIQEQLAQSEKQRQSDHAAMMALFQTVANQVFDIDGKLGENNVYQQIIIQLLEQHMSNAEQWFNQLYILVESGQITVEEAMNQIMKKLDLVNENLEKINATIQTAAQKAEEQRAAQIKLSSIIVKQNCATIQQQQVMIAQNNALIQQNNVIIYNQKVIADKIDNAALSVNATIRECANYLGMKVDDLAAIVVRTGKSLEEVMKMSKTEIVAAINANTAKLEQTNYKLDQINTSVQHVDLSVQDNTGVIVQAASDILDVLNEISADLKALSSKFDQFYNAYKTRSGEYTSILQHISKNGDYTVAELKKLNNTTSALKVDVSNLKQTAIEIRNNLQAGVEIDYDKVEEMFKILNLHQTDSRDKIIAKLDEFINSQDKLEIAINKLGNNLGDKIAYLTTLIKNKTADNEGVIEAINNASKANEANIAAATEQLAAKLDALIKKADVALSKMDKIAENQYTYANQIMLNMDANGKKILDAIKANGKKIDITNATLAEINAQVPGIREDIQKLQKAATTSNTYLDIIANRQLEMIQAIENLEGIAGGGITKAELEELWKAHDANFYAKAKAYLDLLHTDDMNKADEVIEYLKKGNQTALDIYNLLLAEFDKAGNDVEKLRKLLQAVYDYLPNLICNCNCQSDCGNNQTVHEGIVDIIS